MRYKLFLAGLVVTSGYLCIRAYVNNLDFATPMGQAIRGDLHPVHGR